MDLLFLRKLAVLSLLVISIPVNAQKAFSGVVICEVKTKDGTVKINPPSYLPQGKTTQYENIIEQKVENTGCERLLAEFMKNNSLEDMYAYVRNACSDIYSGMTREQRNIFSLVIREKALKKIIDCCLDRLKSE